tara:strand:- start:426 stop:716 length:291 start_codon:yes stop_codon:yes gene_type:complete
MKTKINSTGSMSTQVEDGALKLYSYNTVMGYVKNGKAIMVNEFYSRTTSKHQAKYREMFNLDRDKGELFEYGAFIKRAELDGVNVLGGWNKWKGGL